ncbi:hypothetical protein BDV96DRAFT_569061 [Lophiotrema nucula]|uniref:DUF1275 domain protein n=1 Tax=Lophiotrema nucula TaxID=690887 RepID=A0A6A5ZL01_9PLEO|nr:hypothetical protein BDV96DRAFT_569061 [Lophiotrema nucula]
MSGNTVYLGLGLVAPREGVRWIKAATSIGFFCLGSWFFAHFHRFLSPRRRWVLVASFGLQLLLIVFAAVIVTWFYDPSNQLSWTIIVPIASVAFQSSGQAVTSRALQYPGLTSVVLTSIYCDLFSDPKLFSFSNVERNRRTAAPVSLLIGAMAGGVWAHSSIGLAGALWTAVFLKALVVVAWMFWKADPEEA